MSYASSEKQFYQRHYQGALQIADIEAMEIARLSYFQPGQRYHIVIDELQAKAEYGTAVEVGCSGGQCIAYLAKQFKFSRVVGLDIAFPDGMEQFLGGVQFIQANSNERLPLLDGSVDVYIAMMVIEHLFDPFHAFEEIARVLSPTGKAFVNLPLVTSIKNRLRLLIGKLPETSVPFDRWLAEKEWDGNHLHYFSVPAIRRLAALSGLELTRMDAVGRLHGLKSLFPSLLANELSFVLKRK